MNTYGSATQKGRAWLCGCCPEMGWGELGCPGSLPHQSAAKGASDLDLSDGCGQHGTEACSACLSDSKNHISRLRLVNDQAGKGFCFPYVASSPCAALFRCKHYFLVEFWLASFCTCLVHPLSFFLGRWLLSDHESAA